jgi:hypothetical protein
MLLVLAKQITSLPFQGRTAAALTLRLSMLQKTPQLNAMNPAANMH